MPAPKALEALEAVNFLINCGECVVVLGIARERVERLIGLATAEVAEEMGGEGTSADLDSEKQNRLQRKRYANDYLEKLIQLEVNVPTASAEHLAHVLGLSAPEPDKELSDMLAKRTRTRELTTWVRRAVFGALMIMVSVGAWFSGSLLSAVDMTPIETAGTRVPGAPPATALAAPSESSPGGFAKRISREGQGACLHMVRFVYPPARTTSPTYLFCYWRPLFLVGRLWP